MPYSWSGFFLSRRSAQEADSPLQISAQRVCTLEGQDFYEEEIFKLVSRSDKCLNVYKEPTVRTVTLPDWVIGNKMQTFHGSLCNLSL